MSKTSRLTSSIVGNSYVAVLALYSGVTPDEVRARAVRCSGQGFEMAVEFARRPNGFRGFGVVAKVTVTGPIMSAWIAARDPQPTDELDRTLKAAWPMSESDKDTAADRALHEQAVRLGAVSMQWHVRKLIFWMCGYPA